jgi:hypothetical protein
MYALTYIIYMSSEHVASQFVYMYLHVRN